MQDADERGRYLETAWRDVADCCLDVVWNPLNEVATVLVLVLMRRLLFKAGFC